MSSAVNAPDVQQLPLFRMWYHFTHFLTLTQQIKNQGSPSDDEALRSTGTIMSRFNALKLHQANTEADLIVPLFDMVAFSIPFALAVYWRKKPEIHRRLILVATCALTAAAFGRFPENLLPPVFFYAGVDLLILLGAVRDLVVMRSIHPVYCYALPAFIAGQVVVMYTNTHHSPLWIKIAHAILS